jgi:uncharacterized protein YidB (DUF937 family)
MALLDSVINSVVSAVGGDKAGAINDFISQNGGISGLADTFQKGGAGDLFASWVSTGNNKEITAQQIDAVLGSSQVQDLAKRMGLDPTMASDVVAKALPQLIDKLTPNGQV